MFWGRKKTQKVLVDTEGKIPVIRSSICTGEKVAGFKDMKSGRFEEVMLIRDDNDMEIFLTDYHLKEDEIKVMY